MEPRQGLPHRLFRLPGCGSVPHGHQFGTMDPYQPPEGLGEALRLVEIEGVGGQHSAGGGHYGGLHSRPEARIEAQDRTFARRRLEEELLQVLAEDPDGLPCPPAP
jgi:hypothetical protein